MKITLTIHEITALVADHYHLPSDISVEIAEYSGIDHPDAANLIAKLKEQDCFDGNLVPRFDKKIASIKLLREVYANTRPPGTPACGLANAKYAIEEWAPFIQYVKRYGFPIMGGANDSMPWRNV